MNSHLRTPIGVVATALFGILFLLPVRAETILRAADLGPEFTVGQPENGYVGQLTIMPEHGPVGTPITVSGTGLPPDRTVDLVWRTVRGRWKVADAAYEGREFQPLAYRIARVMTDASGRFTARFAAPRDFGSNHDILVQAGNRVFTKAGFSIDMTVSVSPSSGPVGTPVTIDVDGIGWRQLHNSWLLLYDNAFTGWISSVTTGGSARFTISASGDRGRHVIEIVHGEFTFPYRNMQQSPEPNRPRFVRQFTITDGPAVLPPAPAAQVQDKIDRLPAPAALSASPQFGTVNTPILVRGSGFAPGKELQLEWTTVTGNRVGGDGWKQKSRIIAKAIADAAGAAAFRFTAPDDLGGGHQLSVRAGGADKKGTFWVAPSAFALSVDHGPAGTPFEIHLKGVGWTETANIYTVVYDNAYVGYACGFNSQGDVVIPLYATGAEGWHFIDLYPAIYKGKEARPRNFRIPQLTYANDHPGEDLPRFRFAFRVTSSEGQDSATR
jgi:hypothetical protein